MASRKVYVNLTVKLIMVVDEGVEVSDVVNELDYNFSDTTGSADIEDTSIEDFEITDSK